MADAMMVRLINSLSEKTNTGNLQWTKTDTSERFRASFTGYSVEIVSVVTFNPDIDEDDENIQIRILNGNDELIEEVSYKDFDNFELANEEYPWRVFLALHRGARRSALGMTKAITAIVEQLSGDE